MLRSSRSLSTTLATIALAAVALACDDDPTGPPAVAAVAITAPATSVGIADTLRLTASAADSRGRAIAAARIEWSSLDPGSAQVDSTGLVTGVELGSARIVAEAGSEADTVTLAVLRVSMSIVFTTSRDSLTLGDTLTFTAAVLDGNGRPMPITGMVWSVSDSTVLRVDAAGLVRGVGRGTALVTAAAGQAAGQVEVLVSLTRVPVPDGVVLTAVAVGHVHACALAEDGQAYCWGSNDRGQLGNGEISFGRSSPTAVLGGHTFTLIDAGQDQTCALAADARAYCWGTNTRGRLGVGFTDPSKVTTPTLAGGGRAFKHIGVNHHQGICAAAPDDIAYCWGHNDAYQLGRQPSASVDTAIAPVSGDVALSWADGAIAHACGLTPEGAAYCWGTGADRMPGDTTPRWQPNAKAGGHTFSKLTFGLLHTCGLATTGAAYCWGNNDQAQLGAGASDRAAHPHPTPVAGGLTFVDIAASWATTCGLTAAGEIHCWGSGGGALGNVWMDGATEPVPIGGDRPFRVLGGGLAGFCAVRTDDALVCWG